MTTVASLGVCLVWSLSDGDNGGRVVVVVCVGCDDDDDGVVGDAAVGGRDDGVEVRRVVVEGGDEVV
uniref:Secreted protein n=1 Tax=Tanacetum cinerariifolium TaxID=118510 RepID=A0A699HD09_TANCI|nr:hypothetical protein [Tanacetum cinerariifolium]